MSRKSKIAPQGINIIVDPKTFIIYKKKILIGFGSSSYCYVYTVGDTNDCVVFKIVNKPSESRFGDPVENEISIHSKLDHPNIVKMLNYWSDDKYWYIMLEYCCNGQITKYKPPSSDVARLWLSQLLGAIKYLHEEHNTIHRDIKPHNILLDKKGNIKLADFGLSKCIKSNEYIRGFCGTLNYMAPEVYQDVYSYRADAWSFGCVMYYILTGRPPFHAKLKSDIERVVKSPTTHTVPAAPQEVVLLINEFLDINPDTRLSISAAAEREYFN